MMMLREGRAGLLVLSVSALSLLAANAPLNPTVSVLKTAASPVPLECEEGLAASAAPRIEVSEPSTAMAPAPPSSSLRGELSEAQTAAEHHDRAAFIDPLTRLKATLQPYPPGGERNVATDVVHVYDDLNRLWTYEFENPNGAFFDATNSLLAMLNAYPGYEKAIADQTLTVQATKLYPSRESRDFLVREAAARMGRLTGEKAPAPPVPPPMMRKHAPKVEGKPQVGHKPKVEDKSTPLPKIVKKGKKRVHVPGPVHKKKTPAKAKAPAKPAPTTAPAPVPIPLPPSVVTTTTAPPVTTKTATTKTTTTKTTTTKTTTPPPSTTPTTTAPAPATTTTAAPAPATTTTAATTTAATTTTAAATTTTAATTTAATTATATTATTPPTTTTAPATTTTATETTSSAEPAPEPKPAPSPLRSILLPIILILVGIGVLVVLFRASS